MGLLKKIVKNIVATGAIVTLLVGLNLTVKAYEHGYLKVEKVSL